MTMHRRCGVTRLLCAIALSAGLAPAPARAATGPAAPLASADFSACAKPEWPKGALRAELEGTVTLAFRIDAQGKVVESQLKGSSGSMLLDEAAQEGIARCAFAPSAARGEAGAWFQMQYVWTLKGPSRRPKQEPQPLPFAAAPAALRPFFIQARLADAMADPLQRCLAYPDLPGNQWPAGLAQAYCHVIYEHAITLKQVAGMVDSGALDALDGLYRQDLERHFSKDNFSENIHADIKLFDGSAESERVSKAWVAKAPGSAYANAARGLHLLVLAYNARGGKWAQDTPRENMARMSDFAGQAVEYFGKALRIEPRLLPAHVGVLSAARLHGNDALADGAFERGDALDPACRYLSKERMLALQPRWGGSRGAMQAYAEQLRPLAATRPLLALSVVMPQADQADILMSDKDYAATVKLLEPAVMIAPYPVAGQLGKSMWMLSGDTWETLVRLLVAQRYEDDNFGEARALGTVLLDASDPEWALRSLRRAVALEPDDHYANYKLGDAYYRLLEFERAEPFLLKGLGGSEAHVNEGAFFLLADAMLKSGQLDKAEKHSAAFVRAYPKSARGWFLRADLKSRQGGGKELTAALESFLAAVDMHDPDWADGIAVARHELARSTAPAAGTAKP